MEFILFLLFFAIGLVFLSLLGYYYILLFQSNRDTFERDELVDFQRILSPQVLSNFETEGDLQSGLIAFAISVVVSFLWSLLSAVFGLSTYSNEFTTYFFNSCFIPLVFFYGAPLLQDYLSGNIGSSHIATKLSGQTTALVAGSTSFLFASNITLYGFYHEALFFFVFINIVSLIAVYIYRKREVAIDRISESHEDIEEDLDTEEEPEEEIPA